LNEVIALKALFQFTVGGELFVSNVIA
jgi:hypothetical protein